MGCGASASASKGVVSHTPVRDFVPEDEGQEKGRTGRHGTNSISGSTSANSTPTSSGSLDDRPSHRSAPAAPAPGGEGGSLPSIINKAFKRPAEIEVRTHRKDESSSMVNLPSLSSAWSPGLQSNSSRSSFSSNDSRSSPTSAFSTSHPHQPRTSPTAGDLQRKRLAHSSSTTLLKESSLAASLHREMTISQSSNSHRRDRDSGSSSPRREMGMGQTQSLSPRGARSGRERLVRPLAKSPQERSPAATPSPSENDAKSLRQQALELAEFQSHMGPTKSKTKRPRKPGHEAGRTAPSQPGHQSLPNKPERHRQDRDALPDVHELARMDVAELNKLCKNPRSAVENATSKMAPSTSLPNLKHNNTRLKKAHRAPGVLRGMYGE